MLASKHYSKSHNIVDVCMRFDKFRIVNNLNMYPVVFYLAQHSLDHLDQFVVNMIVKNFVVAGVDYSYSNELLDLIPSLKKISNKMLTF